MTATGSVAETRAPKARAAGHGTSTKGRTSTATRKVPIRVPPIARVRIDTRSVLRRCHGRCMVASNTSGGTSTPRISSFERWMSKAVVNERARPTSTSATVNGTLIRDTSIATAAAIASSPTRVTSVERMARSPVSVAARTMLSIPMNVPRRDTLQEGGSAPDPQRIRKHQVSTSTSDSSFSIATWGSVRSTTTQTRVATSSSMISANPCDSIMSGRIPTTRWPPGRVTRARSRSPEGRSVTFGEGAGGDDRVEDGGLEPQGLAKRHLVQGPVDTLAAGFRQHRRRVVDAHQVPETEVGQAGAHQPGTGPGVQYGCGRRHPAGEVLGDRAGQPVTVGIEQVLLVLRRPPVVAPAAFAGRACAVHPLHSLFGAARCIDVHGREYRQLEWRWEPISLFTCPAE